MLGKSWAVSSNHGAARLSSLLPLALSINPREKRAPHQFKLSRKAVTGPSCFRCCRVDHPWMPFALEKGCRGLKNVHVNQVYRIVCTERHTIMVHASYIQIPTAQALLPHTRKNLCNLITTHTRTTYAKKIQLYISRDYIYLINNYIQTRRVTTNK